MSQKFAKNQTTHPDTYNKTFNGSVVVVSGKGRDIIGQFTEEKVVSRPLINIPIVATTRPVSDPPYQVMVAGSGTIGGGTGGGTTFSPSLIFSDSRNSMYIGAL
jgi:hypothetical protein